MVSDESGFSLVELLITTVVLGFVAIGFSTLFTSIQNVQNASAHQEAATRAGQRQIEALRNNNYAQLTPGQTIDFTNNLPSNMPANSTGTAVVSEPYEGIRRVDVTVTYPYGSSNREIKLSSLIGEIGITQ